MRLKRYNTARWTENTGAPPENQKETRRFITNLEHKLCGKGFCVRNKIDSAAVPVYNKNYQGFR